MPTLLQLDEKRSQGVCGRRQRDLGGGSRFLRRIFSTGTLPKVEQSQTQKRGPSSGNPMISNVETRRKSLLNTVSIEVQGRIIHSVQTQRRPIKMRTTILYLRNRWMDSKKLLTPKRLLSSDKFVASISLNSTILFKLG